MATDFYSNYSSDNFRVARSRLFDSPTAATYNAIRVPRFALVLGVHLNIITAFGAAGTITVGYSSYSGGSSADFFFDTVTADAEVIGNKFSGVGFHAYTDSAIITVTTVTGGAAGDFFIFVPYIIIH